MMYAKNWSSKSLISHPCRATSEDTAAISSTLEATAVVSTRWVTATVYSAMSTAIDNAMRGLASTFSPNRLAAVTASTAVGARRRQARLMVPMAARAPAGTGCGARTSVIRANPVSTMASAASLVKGVGPAIDCARPTAASTHGMVRACTMAVLAVMTLAPARMMTVQIVTPGERR